MNTAEILKSLREQHGLSQQEVADKLKIDRTTYVKYESGSSKPVRKLSELAALFGVTTDYLLGNAIDPASLTNYLGPVVENKKIPIIGSVKCGPNGLAYEYLQGYVFIDDGLTGDITAFICKGDSMKDIGISNGDIAIVRRQCTIENGELAVVIINGEEGTLKRVRYHDNVMILEAANPAYPSRIFSGKEMNIVKIFGKVIQVRKNF